MRRLTREEVQQIAEDHRRSSPHVTGVAPVIVPPVRDPEPEAAPGDEEAFFEESAAADKSCSTCGGLPYGSETYVLPCPECGRTTAPPRVEPEPTRAYQHIPPPLRTALGLREDDEDAVDEDALLHPASTRPFVITDNDGDTVEQIGCRICGGTRFEVAQAYVLTVLRCPTCGWEHVIHDG